MLQNGVRKKHIICFLIHASYVCCDCLQACYVSFQKTRHLMSMHACLCTIGSQQTKRMLLSVSKQSSNQ